jgi:hypothetical protein
MGFPQMDVQIDKHAAVEDYSIDTRFKLKLVICSNIQHDAWVEG